VIYAPHLRAASLELLAKLEAYVKKGGILVGDVQFAFEDPWGKLHRNGPDGAIASLFGAYVDTIHDARTAAPRLNGLEVPGFYGDLTATSARILARFDHGLPAITERLLGAGRAVLLGYDAGMACFKPGAAAWEKLLADQLLGGGLPRPGWSSDAPLAFRLSAPAADHYFLLNPGPARTAFIRAYDCAYRSGEQVLEEQALDVTGSLAVEIPAESAVWVRLEK
jgi:beta-galactosidase